jgi:uncharacterized repeat protein (TIGR01451 family)
MKIRGGEKMRRFLFPIVAIVLAIGLAIPMATPVMAATGTVMVKSDTTVQIVGVYNKALGGSVFVDLSGNPLNAVRAQEPKPYATGYASEPPEATDSIWDTNVDWSFQNNAPDADWIWETERAEGPASYNSSDPLYDADASTNGRVVMFQKTFTICGIPQDGMLDIAADNCWEVLINNTFLARSPIAVAGWETSNLSQTFVPSQGWQNVGHVTVPAAMLVDGVNTITILAGNEKFAAGDDGDSPIPPLSPDPNNYYQYNPGALIFSLTAAYEEEAASLTIVKSGELAKAKCKDNDKDWDKDWNWNKKCWKQCWNKKKDWANIGDKINYTFEVTNTGDVTLTNVTVSDVPPLTKGPVPASVASLAPGATAMFHGRYTLTQADIDAGYVEDTATATGTAPCGQDVTANGSTMVTIPQSALIALVKDGKLDMRVVKPDDQANVGDKINYTFKVINRGNVTLTNVTVSDVPALTTGPVPASVDSLAPGAITTFTGSYTLTQNDIDAGKVIDTATATGTTPSGEQVTDKDREIVTIPHKCKGH